ncbi:cytochrome-c oxidase, cbb3-type subunit III [Thiotrichales bacterium HSG1]|nr:cytochrome-c oxidase, cbb3-type subunit III [Thiotrichales bacterium HSG1]
MFDSSLFTSQFWEWFIIIPTVGGILGCFGLIIWLSGSSPDPDEKVETMGHVWDEDLAEYNNPLPKWWLYMFYITLFYSIGYLLVYPGLGSFKGFFGWTEVNQYEAEMKAADEMYMPIFTKYQNEPIAELIKKPEAVQIGHRLFMTYCTVCHGSDARGVKGFPNLQDDDWLYGSTPDVITASIMTGRQGIMPAAAANGLTTDADVNNITQYVLSLSSAEHGTKYDATAAVEGEKTFKRICFACHGPDGKGVQAMGAPNLTDNTWLYGGSESDVKETIIKGRQGRMPAHGEFLGEAKVHLLSTYIYSLSNK